MYFQLNSYFLFMNNFDTGIVTMIEIRIFINVREYSSWQNESAKKTTQKHLISLTNGIDVTSDDYCPTQLTATEK